jgi:transcription initiation factor TFIIIB Brf1 subunit/transcription initiation factor TFIIB
MPASSTLSPHIFERMPPARRRLFELALLLAGWTLFGLFMAWQVYAMAGRMGRPIDGQQALTGELIYAYAWALLTPLVLYLGRKFYLERGRFLSRLFIHVPASIVVALLHRALFALARGLYHALRTQEPFAAGDWSVHLISYLDYGILLYWMIIILQHAFVYYRHFQEKALQASQLETQLAQAQLQALRMQLQPHFLFNTLNAISVLIPKDQEAARRMLRHLSEFLRLTLQNNGAQLIPLETELDLLDRYLQIERARFGDRLAIQRSVTGEALHAQVPNLILQPLVENAVRHGLAAQRGPALIAISATRENGTLRLQVRDNGRGLATGNGSQDGSGIGLSNTRARLQQLYGERYRFELSSAEEGGVVVTMEIPFQTMHEDA